MWEGSAALKAHIWAPSPTVEKFSLQRRPAVNWKFWQKPKCAPEHNPWQPQESAPYALYEHRDGTYYRRYEQGYIEVHKNGKWDYVVFTYDL